MLFIIARLSAVHVEAMVDCQECGASWVSFDHGGGVGMGYSLHAGMVIVADGTDAAEARLRRVLTLIIFAAAKN